MRRALAQIAEKNLLWLFSVNETRYSLFDYIINVFRVRKVVSNGELES